MTNTLAYSAEKSFVTGANPVKKFGVNLLLFGKLDRFSTLAKVASH
jgi:hypothetical protein